MNCSKLKRREVFKKITPLICRTKQQKQKRVCVDISTRLVVVLLLPVVLVFLGGMLIACVFVYGAAGVNWHKPYTGYPIHSPGMMPMVDHGHHKEEEHRGNSPRVVCVTVVSCKCV